MFVHLQATAAAGLIGAMTAVIFSGARNSIGETLFIIVAVTGTIPRNIYFKST